MNYTREEILRTLDLAVLKPTASTGDVIAAAKTVRELGMASVCVAPANVKMARQHTDRVCSVIGFPHGNTLPADKMQEAINACENGARELDVVVNYGRLLEGACGNEEDPEPDWLGLELVMDVAENYGARVKAILETCYLSPEEIAFACQLCVLVGVDWVKTSTGFGPGGATPEAVKIMVKAVQKKAQVKAAGGIKTYADACRYLDLGCTRLGVGAASYEGLLP
jgi:deoxyribose-phosphate aldolase